MNRTASSATLDLTRDITAATRLGTSIEQVNLLIGEAIDTLGGLIPFDLATVMELRGEELFVRVARGNLANPQVEEHHLRLSQFNTLQELLRHGRARAFTEADHRSEGDAFDGVLDLPHGHFCMVVPLKVREEAIGIMTFDRRQCGIYPPEVVELAKVFGRLLALAINYGAQSLLLERLRGQLHEQNRLLTEQVAGPGDAGQRLERSQSRAMRAIVEQAKLVARTDTPVLITGETGTGKEVLAHALHGWSTRHDRPLISLNCAALPATLMESELFGHVKGAFSGAVSPRMGRFQTANGGTLFLDEIGELPLELQAKLLRAVQEGCFEPVGSDRTVRVDVRLIAATNADLPVAVAEHAFREDLYYRLAVFPLHLPPLSLRREDIALIAQDFLATLAQRRGRPPWRLSAASSRWLEDQPWPGNVRELVNTLERATILAAGQILELNQPYEAIQSSESPLLPTALVGKEPLLTLEEAERQHIARALAACGGQLHGAGAAAEVLGINPSTLRSRMKKLGLTKSKIIR